MELCYCHYAILLGANQLFAAKQHRSDRSNGRQNAHDDDQHTRAAAHAFFWRLCRRCFSGV